jgi:uncharacterized protein
MDYLGNGFDKQFTHWYSKVMEVIHPERGITDRSCMTITMVVTKACNFACTYCYQHGKNQESMNSGTAKEIVDFILSDRVNNYIDVDKSPCVILEFIGGEPLLEIDLIEEFMDYFVYKSMELNHRWATEYTISMSSNGSLYLTPKVQSFIKKYNGRCNIAITIDGTKELHDACRVYRDGRGTYDDVRKGIEDYFRNGGSRSTKMTIAPENLKYLCDASLHLFDIGYEYLYCNVVFENVWNTELSKELYSQLKKLADIMIDKELYKNHYQAMFTEDIGTPLPETDNTNWCGGDGSMLAFDTQGNCYPCLRYIDYCLSVPGRKPFTIGNIEDGIVNREDSPMLCELKNITRRSQSTDECWNCPIAKGCSWCSAYNYDVYGTANKRATFHCIMQKARVLACCYYYNNLFRKLNINKRFEYHMPDEWALDIIDQNEIDLLKNLSMED